MNFPDFTDKVVSFSIVEDKYNHDLVNPHIEEQAGRLFVVGQSPVGATDSGWMDNKQVAFPWDSVYEYVIFDDIDDWKQATEKAENYNKEK